MLPLRARQYFRTTIKTVLLLKLKDSAAVVEELIRLILNFAVSVVLLCCNLSDKK